MPLISPLDATEYRETPDPIPNYEPGTIAETHPNQHHVLAFLSNRTEGLDGGTLV